MFAVNPIYQGKSSGIPHRRARGRSRLGATGGSAGYGTARTNFPLVFHDARAPLARTSNNSDRSGSDYREKDSARTGTHGSVSSRFSALASYRLPMSCECAGKCTGIRVTEPPAPDDNDIEAPQLILMPPKTFANNALDSIPVDCLVYVLLCDRKPEPRCAFPIRGAQHHHHVIG